MVGEEEEKPPSPAAVVQVQVRAELLLFLPVSFKSFTLQLLVSKPFLCGILFFFSLSRADDTVERGGGTRDETRR